MLPEWINALSTIGALLVAAWALVRSSKRETGEDLDTRIDTRIALRLAPDIAVIKEQLSGIRTTLNAAATHDASLVRAAVEATSAAIESAADSMRDRVGTRRRAGDPSS